MSIPGCGVALIQTYFRVLRAQNNRLRSVPSEFEALTALEELRLGGNRLLTLPTALHTLKKVCQSLSEFEYLIISSGEYPSHR